MPALGVPPTQYLDVFINTEALPAPSFWVFVEGSYPGTVDSITDHWCDSTSNPSALPGGESRGGSAVRSNSLIMWLVHLTVPILRGFPKVMLLT